MSFSIYFDTDAYSVDGPQLMGRNMAGYSFIKGYLKHSRDENIPFLMGDVQDSLAINRLSKLIGNSKTINAHAPHDFNTLKISGGLFYPGPDIAMLASKRSFFGNDSWSLCGITHTTSSAGAMDSIVNIVTSQVQIWDSLICTSTAVKDNVSRLLQSQVDFLRSRLGITNLVLPLMPVIPLGINTVDFDITEDQKNYSRSVLSIQSDELVFLYMGRLSFHAKAHPLAMYQALEATVKETGKKIVLIECGWHANEFIANSFNEAAKIFCPSVRLIALDGRNPETRKMAWASGDIFCSLSDNIQETFGITPIEAMAAGMPVVVSDWDGYKDTVRDGIDGFRIPSMMPDSGLGADLALRYALNVDSYDMYCGHTSSLVSIDVSATASAFIKLVNSSNLRKKMGETGKLRAQSIYDWSVIIPQYENLWLSQNEIRKYHSNVINKLPHPWPSRMDPFFSFAGYPTYTLTANTKLCLVNDSAVSLKRIKDIMKLSMIIYAKEIIPTDAELAAVLNAATMEPQYAHLLIESISMERKLFVLRALSWLVKIGILKVVGNTH